MDFLASALTYAAANIDRLVLARQFPVALIGVFGLARTIADLPSMLAGRLGYQLLMPAFAAWRDRRDAGELAHFLRLRGRFLLAAGLGLAGLAGLADVAVGVLYDARYHAAGWMLAVLLLGSWFTLPASLNEATLVGLGHPLRIGRANAAKFVVLVALPLVAARWGLAGRCWRWWRPKPCALPCWRMKCRAICGWRGRIWR
jgi:O-antigen/teichoic acid export membrane protein